MGFGDNVTFFGRSVTFTAEVKTFVPHPFEDCSPFGGFQGDSVRPCESRGHKSNTPACLHSISLTLKVLLYVSKFAPWSSRLSMEDDFFNFDPLY